LKPREMSGIITTEYGFHIIQVLEKQEARLRPFAEVAPELAEEVKKRYVFDSVQKLSEQARAALSSAPNGAAKIAAELKLQLVSAEKFGRGDPIPQLGPSREIEEAVSTLRKNDVSPILQISPTRLAVAAVTEVFPARQAELLEAADGIRQRLTQQKLNGLVEERAKAALEKSRATNGDLKQVAQALGLEFKAAPEFTSDGAAEGLGSASYLQEAFSHDVGYVFGPLVVGEKRFICKVTGKKPADLVELASQRQDMVDQIKARKARQRREVLQDSIRDQLVKEGKVKINQGVINRLVSSYSAAQSAT